MAGNTLQVELLFVNGEFTPETVGYVSNLVKVPRNFLFMGCPTDTFQFNIGEFGGVRVITKYRKHIIHDEHKNIDIEVSGPE